MSFESEVITSLSILLGVISTVMGYYYARRGKEETEAKASEKFDELSDLLKTASSKIKEMEDEIESKRKRVKELDKMKKELDGLVSLREEQVTAIRSELKSLMDASARRNRIWTIAMGAIWFIIGLVFRGFLGF